MKNNINPMTITITPAGLNRFHEIFHNQIAKLLSHVLDSLTNSIFKVFTQRWGVGEDQRKNSQGIKSQDFGA